MFTFVDIPFNIATTSIVSTGVDRVVSLNNVTNSIFTDIMIDTAGYFGLSNFNPK